MSYLEEIEKIADERAEQKREFQAALTVVAAAQAWQRGWEQRRQRTGRYDDFEEFLSRSLDEYQQRKTRYDAEEE